MTTISNEELHTVGGGWCIPLSVAAAAIYYLSDGGICIGISNEAN